VLLLLILAPRVVGGGISNGGNTGINEAQNIVTVVVNMVIKLLVRIITISYLCIRDSGGV
jgi:hypothetical protein